VDQETKREIIDEKLVLDDMMNISFYNNRYSASHNNPSNKNRSTLKLILSAYQKKNKTTFDSSTIYRQDNSKHNFLLILSASAG